MKRAPSVESDRALFRLSVAQSLIIRIVATVPCAIAVAADAILLGT